MLLRKSLQMHWSFPRVVTLSRLENSSPASSPTATGLMNFFYGVRNSLNQGEAGFTARFTHWRRRSKGRLITSLILIKTPILAARRGERCPRWDARKQSSHMQLGPKQYLVPTAFYSSCYTSESCHQHFLDINQCQDQRGEEEERLRSRALLNLTKSNTWIVVVLAARGHGGGLQASRRHLKFSAVVGYSLSPTWHSFLAAELQRESLSSGKEMPEQLRW